MPPLIEWFKLILLTILAVLAFQTFYKVLDFIREEHRLDREATIIITKLQLKK